MQYDLLARGQYFPRGLVLHQQPALTRMIHDGDSLRRRPDTYNLKVSNDGATKENVTASSAEQVPPSAESGKLKDAGLIAAAAHATVPNWANMVLMISLIFGGCCANVSE